MGRKAVDPQNAEQVKYGTVAPDGTVVNIPTPAKPA